jgi:hypothetical protein
MYNQVTIAHQSSAPLDTTNDRPHEGRPAVEFDRLTPVSVDDCGKEQQTDGRISRVYEPLATPLGLANNAAYLHNRSSQCAHPPISLGNWIPAPHSAGHEEQAPPFHVPDPAGDAYLAGLNVAALDVGEAALSPRLMPGWVEHLQTIGILPPDAVIHEVDFNVVEVPVVESGHAVSKLAGYPHTDILSQAAAQGVRFEAGQLVSATFPTPFVQGQIEKLGGTLIQGSDASRTNNKHEFRQAATRYGFSVFPGASVSSEAELLAHVEELRAKSDEVRAFGRDLKYIARLKDPCSSGGDGVRGVESPISEAGLRHALDGILGGIERSYHLAEYADRSMAFRWQNGRTGSFPRPLVLEHDAATVGDVLFNGSFMVEIHDDGRYAVPRYFGQKTDREGSFRGGYTIDPNSSQWSSTFTESVQELLARSIDGVVRYWHGELGVRGMAGVDFMLVRRYEDGAVVPYLFDPNVRPTINSISSVVARKVERAFGFPAWENINGWAANDLTSMSDFEELLNLGGELDLYRGCKYGIVVPIAHRAMFARGENGEVSCIRPACSAKFLIAAPNEEMVEKISNLLAQRRGLRYSADEQ